MKISANKKAYIKAKIAAQRFLRACTNPLSLEIEKAQIAANGGLKLSYIGVNRSNSNSQLIGISKKPMTRGQSRLNMQFENQKYFHPETC